MRLWIRLPLFLLAVSLVPLFFSGLHAVNTATNAATAQSKEQLERDAAVRAEQIGRWTRDQARFLAGWTQLYPSRLASMAPELQDGLLKAVYVAMPSAVVVALVDADGLPVVPPRFSPVAGDRPAGDAPRADRLVARMPLSDATLSGGVHVGAPYLPEPDGTPSVAIAALATPLPAVARGADPIADPAPVAGRPERTLVLGAEVQLEVVAEILAQATDDLGFALLDGAGEVLAGAAHPLIRPRLVRALTGTTAQFEYELEDGELVMGAVAPVPHTDWSVVVVRPARLVLEPAAEISARTRAVFQVSFAAALFLGWILAQSLLDPVERLRDAALAVAEGDYGRRIGFDRRDELGELGRAFDHMSERLLANQREIRAQQEEIEAFNRELQHRVEQRTAELRDAQAQLVRSGQLAAVAEIGAGLAHELNNPLAAILGVAQLLRARRAGTPDAFLLDDLVEQAERCRDVVATLLRFSSGEVDPRKAPVVDLREVLHEVSTLVRGPFRQRGVTLELVHPGHELPVRIDPVHGTRILAQILNALRAGLNEGVHLRISARRLGNGDIEVRLQPDQPVAVDETRRDDWMASGMGLWVARRLLHELGGRLEQPVAVDVAGGRIPTDELPATPVQGAPAAPHDHAWRIHLPGA